MARAALSASQGRQPGRNKQPVLLGTESLDIIVKEEKNTHPLKLALHSSPINL